MTGTAIKPEHETVTDSHELPVYTEQQIEDHCRRASSICDLFESNSGLVLESVQIIRQLQEDIKNRDKLDKQNFEALRACSLSARE